MRQCRTFYLVLLSSLCVGSRYGVQCNCRIDVSVTFLSHKLNTHALPHSSTSFGSKLVTTVILSHFLLLLQSVKLVWSGRSDDLFCLFGGIFHDVHLKNPKNMFSVHLHNSAPGLEELALKRSRGSSAEVHPRLLRHTAFVLIVWLCVCMWSGAECSGG
jgi:hypothetical protein